jgi:RNA polymerase sigma factor for flagellar operon FliA
MTEAEVEDCLSAIKLTQPETWHDELSSWRSACQDAPDPQTCLDAEEERRLLADAIEELPERLRVILSLYYVEDLRLLEIGEVLNLSESRVSRLLVQAQLQLKTILERKHSRTSGR